MGGITPFDRYIRDNFLSMSMWGAGSIAIIKDAVLKASEKEESIQQILEDIALPTVSQQTTEGETIEKEISIEEALIEVNKKIAKKEQLTAADKAFIESFVKAMNESLQKLHSADNLKQMLVDAGVSFSEIPDLYRAYKNLIPNVALRNEIGNQLVSLIFIYVNKTLREKYPQYEKASFTDIIQDYGADRILGAIRRRITSDKYIALIESKIQESIAKRGAKDKTTLKLQEGLEVLKKLKNDEDGKLWAACMYMAKSTILQATKVKITNTYDKETKKNIVIKLKEDDIDLMDSDTEVYSAEDEGPEHWMLKTDTLSTFKGMATEVKSLLYSINTGKIGALGVKEILSPINTYKKLMNIRIHHNCQNSDELLEVLRAYEEREKDVALEDKRFPFIPSLLKTLKEDTSGRLTTLLFTTLKKDSIHYVAHNKVRTYVNKKKATSIYRNTEGVSENVVLGNYVAEMLNINSNNTRCIFDVNGSIREKEKATFIQDMENWETRYSEESEQGESALNEWKRDRVLYINDALNMHMSEADIKALTDNSKEFNKFMSEVALFAEALSNGNSIKNFAEFAEQSKISKHIRKSLAIARKNFTPFEEVGENVFRYNKSSYQLSVVPNFLSDLFERLYASFKTKNFKTYLKEHYLNCPIFAVKDKEGNIVKVRNPWLKKMYEGDSNFTEDFLKSITRGLGTMVKPFEDFSEKDNLIFTLTEYIQKFIDSEGTYGKVPLFITGDSNSTRYLTCPVFDTNEAINSLVDLAMGEFDRMTMFKEFDAMCGDTYTNNRTISENASKFTLFPSLNEHYNELMQLEGEARREKVEKYIKQELDNLYKNDFLKVLKKEGIVIGEDSYGLNPEALYLGEYADTVKTLYNGNERAFLYNMYLNLKLGMLSEQQLLTIDSGFYENVIDFQKRFKEVIAAGEILDLSAKWHGVAVGNNTKHPEANNHQRCIYLDEIRTSSDDTFINCLKANGMDSKDIDKYTKNNGNKGNTLTDGQGYRSFPSYRKIMIMRGLWTEDMESVFKIVQKAHEEKRPLSLEERKEIQSLNVVFQPIKPFYFGFEYLDNGTMIPVQHKYAEIPLIPELMPKGSNDRLKNLGDYMWDNDVDLACFTSCVKVGAWGSVDISEAKDMDSLSQTLSKAKTHLLHLEGYRQQTNVPEHNDNTRARGKQAIVHLFGSITPDDVQAKHYDFLKEFPNGVIKITEDKRGHINIKNGLSILSMIKYYGALGSIGYLQSIKALNKRVSSNIEISRTLSDIRANDSRGAKDAFFSYELNSKGDLTLSPAEGVNAPDNVAALMSLFRKEIVKQGMQGGSLVQASAYGYEDVLKIHYSDNGTNITYADCIKPFDFSITDTQGNKIELDYFTYVDPETGNPLKEDGSKFSDEEIEELEKEGIDWRAQTKLNKDYPGIFDLIAYRIPTERAYSMLNLKIRKFTPKTMGGIIMVPTEYTTIAGFDFDKY